MTHIAETLREAFTSVVGTIRRSFDFGGRARRTEVLYYGIALSIVGSALTQGIGATLHWPSSVIAKEAVGLVGVILFSALLVRRAHDHGRSGWWLVMLPLVVASNVYDSLRVQLHAYDPAWPDFGAWNLLLIVPVLLIMGLVFADGDVGDNKYGPDPRLDVPQGSHA